MEQGFHYLSCFAWKVHRLIYIGCWELFYLTRVPGTQYLIRILRIIFLSQYPVQRPLNARMTIQAEQYELVLCPQNDSLLLTHSIEFKNILISGGNLKLLVTQCKPVTVWIVLCPGWEVKYSSVELLQRIKHRTVVLIEQTLRYM